VLDPARHLAALARSAATRPREAGRNRQALRELETASLGVPGGLELEWLGVAGFRLSFQGHTLLIDLYLSRAPLASLLRRRPALPDPAMLDRFLDPPGRVVGVLVGHTHFDHAVDAPAAARRFGCPALGSRSLGRLMRLHGVGERAVEVEPYRTYELGAFSVTFVSSVHSPLLLGRAVPFDGELSCGDVQRRWPGAYRCRQVCRLCHQGSADLLDDAIRHHGVDVFLAGVAGREFSRYYWGRILPELEPRVVVASHFDDFFRPLAAPMGLAPNVNLARLPEEVRAVARDVRVCALPLMEPVAG
jgi:L-ascorbate metabolism protein UlaG (beta-lactamase superfamily)